MKIKIISLCLLLTLSLIIVAGCVDESTDNANMTIKDNVVNETEFGEVMAEANIAYVKALVSTSQKNISASQLYIGELEDKLTYVSDTFGDFPPEMYANDENWHNDINNAVQIAESSQEMLDEGYIEGAHEALEPMRDLFFNLHERNNILHMGDYLTIFHMTMEETITAANENDTEMVASYIPELEKQWQDVKDADRPASADNGYNQSLATVDTAIGVLDESVATGNAIQIQQDAENLRLAFAKVFAKYGVVIS